MLTAATAARVRGAALGAVGLACVVCMLQATAHPFGAGGDPAIFGGVYTAGTVLIGVICLARAAASDRERRTWLAVGSALTLAGLANGLYSLAWFAQWPTMTAACLTWVTAYGLGFLGLSALVRARLHGVSLAAWLDGIAAAFVIESLTALIFLRSVETRIEHGGLAPAVPLAFPVLDVLLLTLVATAAAHGRWQLRDWKVIGAGCLLMAIGDSANAAHMVRGSVTPVSASNVVSMVAFAFFAVAAWQPLPPVAEAKRPWPLVPAVFGLAALAALMLTTTGSHSEIASTLAAVAMAAVIARFALTLTANERMLEVAQAAAATDTLTGLANRRVLLDDLDTACRMAADDAPRTLMLFDLDGFKDYNDTFGHQRGDMLLVDLGERLSRAVAGFGEVYRIGGDEFCLLTTASVTTPREVAQRAVAALSTVCDGLQIGASAGVAAIPGEARTVSDALRLADERMYANKRVERARPVDAGLGEPRAVGVRP